MSYTYQVPGPRIRPRLPNFRSALLDGPAHGGSAHELTLLGSHLKATGWNPHERRTLGAVLYDSIRF
jgi:hypothetical protein